MKTEPPKQAADRSRPCCGSRGCFLGPCGQTTASLLAQEPACASWGGHHRAELHLSTDSTNKEKWRPALSGGPGQCPEGEKRTRGIRVGKEEGKSLDLWMICMCSQRTLQSPRKASWGCCMSWAGSQDVRSVHKTKCTSINQQHTMGNKTLFHVPFKTAFQNMKCVRYE